jgi:biotin transport system substrate-specific component
MKTTDMVKTAVFAALICVLAPFALPVGPVPVSLATFAVYVAAAVLGKKHGVIAVLIYILLGMAGVPVFAGFSGGAQKLFGLTGGYIIGYLPLAFIAGLFAEKRPFGKASAAVGMVLGTLVLYIFGTAWFVIQSGSALVTALGLCVLPFLPGDAAKIAVSSVLVPVIRARTVPRRET